MLKEHRLGLVVGGVFVGLVGVLVVLKWGQPPAETQSPPPASPTVAMNGKGHKPDPKAADSTESKGSEVDPPASVRLEKDPPLDLAPGPSLDPTPSGPPGPPAYDPEPNPVKSGGPPGPALGAPPGPVAEDPEPKVVKITAPPGPPPPGVPLAPLTGSDDPPDEDPAKASHERKTTPVKIGGDVDPPPTESIKVSGPGPLDPPPSPPPIKVGAPPGSTGDDDPKDAGPKPIKLEAPPPDAPPTVKVVSPAPSDAPSKWMDPATPEPPVRVIGSPTISTPPPLAAGTQPLRPITPGASVDSWDERVETARPGDDFRSLSKQYYNSEDFADALLQYNRNHPRAGDALRTDGVLRAGDRVYIPSSEVLKQRHPASMGRPKPFGAGAVDGAVERAAFKSVAAPPAPTSAAPMRKYRVQADGGEFMASIAKRSLGDSGRWVEIAQLNPGVSAERPIPAGTELQLPAEARLP
jgi:hypothetical protein